MGDQDEIHLLRWFLQRFQHDVGRGGHHGLRLVDDAQMRRPVKRGHGIQKGPELVDAELCPHRPEIPHTVIRGGEHRLLFQLRVRCPGLCLLIHVAPRQRSCEVQSRRGFSQSLIAVKISV